MFFISISMTSGVDWEPLHRRMDSQGSQHSHITVRPVMATAQVPLSLNTQAMFAPPIGPSYLTTGEIMMYTTPSSAQIVINNNLNQCLLTQSVCRCALGVPSAACLVHQSRLAFGQTSSSVAPTQVHSSSQTGNNSNLDEGSSSLLSYTESSTQNRNDAISLARDATSLPGIRRQIRNPCRIKRGPASNSRSGVAAPKLRRVASEGSGENLSSLPDEHTQETSTPQSTSSQLVTGPVPSGPQACSSCGPGQRCTACAPALYPVCPTCPNLTSYVGHLANPQNLHLLNIHQTSQGIPNLLHQHHSQHQATLNSLQMVHDALITSQVQQSYLQQDIYRPAHLVQQQQQFVSRLYPTAFVPVPLDFLFFPHDIIDPRANVMDRHHMFAAQIPIHTEPQPIGLNNEEIDKCSEKVHFVRDGEVPETEQERCTVCQCEFENGEELRNLFCTHQFHVECIDRWLNYNKKCPVCRVDIDHHQKPVLVE